MVARSINIAALAVLPDLVGRVLERFVGLSTINDALQPPQRVVALLGVGRSVVGERAPLRLRLLRVDGS